MRKGEKNRNKEDREKWKKKIGVKSLTGIYMYIHIVFVL